MAGDQSANDLHEFDQVNLIAVGRLSWVFPDQQALTIRQPFPSPLPPHEFIGAPPATFGEKSAQFVMATQYPVLLVIEDSGHEWALEDGVLAVEREQTLRIERPGALVPLAKDPRAIGAEVASHHIVLPSANFSHPFFCGVQPNPDFS